MVRRVQPRQALDPRRDTMIINGDFNVWQRGASFTSAASGTRHADTWNWYQSGSGVVDISRSTDVPSLAQLGRAAQYSLLVDCTTADGSLAATDFYEVGTLIEGYRWAPYAQRTFTHGFWVKSTKTGQFYVSYTNTGLDRSIVMPYTVNASDTWEWKTIVVPASPSAGTWDYTTGIGLYIMWALAAGSNFQTTAGAWQTGDFHITSSAVNAMDSTSNNFRLFGSRTSPGVALMPGFDFFDEELQKCQRYYQKTFDYATTPASNTGTGTGPINFLQIVGAATANGPSHRVFFPGGRMRAAPTITGYNPGASGSEVRNTSVSANCTTTAFANTTETGTQVSFTTAAGSAIGNSNRLHITMEAGLA